MTGVESAIVLFCFGYFEKNVCHCIDVAECDLPIFQFFFCKALLATPVSSGATSFCSRSHLIRFIPEQLLRSLPQDISVCCSEILDGIAWCENEHHNFRQSDWLADVD